MGKILKSMGRGLRLAFKTVTFHWKQYFCFFVAILAMQTMFGIIVMSSSKNVDEYTKTVESKYSWHFAMTNLDEGQRKYFEEKFEGGSTKNLTPYVCYSNSADTGAGILYMQILTEQLEGKSLETAFSEFKNEYLEKKMPSGKTKYEDVAYQFSPLYKLDSKLLDLRLECAVKLLVLAAVSIAVIMLLFNIRLNHFKFTYGIYMSFGADTKKLFFTSFWDMIVIGVITFIPATAISSVGTFLLLSGGEFSGKLIAEFLKTCVPFMVFVLLFIIPVCVTAVIVPIKFTASKPPLKLLSAEDNSNLVSSPRISKQLLGKKFPKAYESLGLFRFRRYVATVVASSVLFAAVFVWISFYSTIYDFNTNQKQSEFTVNVSGEMEIVKEYVKTGKVNDVTDEFERIKSYIYRDGVSINKLATFEKFYKAEYTIVYFESGDHQGTVRDVTDKDGNSVREEYIEARNAVVKEGYQADSTNVFTHNKNLQDRFPEFEKYISDGDDEYGKNNPQKQYYQYRTEEGHVTKVFRKKAESTYNYDALKDDMKAVTSKLEALAEKEKFTLLKSIDFDLLESKNSKANDASLKVNHYYIGFEEDNVKAFSGYDYNQRVDMRVTNHVQFAAIDSDGYNLDFLRQYELDILGGEKELTLSEMYEGDEKYIIISETAANSQVLKIKPGDKVQIGYTADLKGEYDETRAEDELLFDYIKNDEFGNTGTYTVYAVIKNMPTGQNIPVYLLEDDYYEVTGIENISNSFSVYLAANATPAEISELYEKLVNEVGDKSVVTWNNAIEENREKIDMNGITVIKIIALFSLILSPLFWFFSQIMFYGKRDEEFRMLRGLGATEREIKKIFRKDGRIFALIGAASAVAFSMLGIFVITKLNKLFVAFFDNGALHLYRFEMPWMALAIAVAVTAICAYLSSIVPYIINKRKVNKALSREFGDE